MKKRKRVRWLIFLLVIIILVVLGIRHKNQKIEQEQLSTQVSEETSQVPDWIDVDLLDVNPYSRPGIALKQVNGIIIHYTANQGSTAKQNRDYFNNLQDTHTTKASAHFIVGLEGEVVQCIPTVEMAYASHPRNSDTLAIECCYDSDDASFNEKTEAAMVKLTAWLCKKYHLTSENLLRHYDVSGKECPKYYVDNPDAWEQFCKQVQKKLDED